jgi:hypothetical protein
MIIVCFVLRNTQLSQAADIRVTGPYIPRFLNPEISLPRTKEPTSGPHPQPFNPVHSFTPYLREMLFHLDTEQLSRHSN